MTREQIDKYLLAWIVSRRTRHRDRVIAKAKRRAAAMVAAAENRAEELNKTLQAERTRFRHDLAERDHKIELLELEVRGLVGINTRYHQHVERDLAVFSRQIEGAKSASVRAPDY